MPAGDAEVRTMSLKIVPLLYRSRGGQSNKFHIDNGLTIGCMTTASMVSTPITDLIAFGILKEMAC